MNKTQQTILVAGILLITAGMGLFIYSSEYKSSDKILIQKKEDTSLLLVKAYEFLAHNSRESAEQAQELCSAILDRNESQLFNQKALLCLGQSLEILDRKNEALRHYRLIKTEKALTAQILDETDFHMGRILMHSTQPKEGVSIMKALLRRTSDPILKSEIYSEFGKYYYRLGNYDRSLKNFLIALKHNPENLQAELGRAKIQDRNKPRSPQAEIADPVVSTPTIPVVTPEQKSPPLPEIKHTASSDHCQTFSDGIVSYKSGKYKQAINSLKKCLTSGSSELEVENSLYWLGESYLSLGDSETASAYFDRVVKNSIVKMDQPAYIKKGIILFRSREYKKAAAYFHIAENNFKEHPYTTKAREWLKETEAQIKENSMLRELDDNDD